MHPSLVVRGARSAWKGPYFVSFPNLKHAIENNIAIKTEARGSTILPNFVGARFEVHNGQTYVPIMVTQDMVGHKLGEFAQTRKRFKYRCVV
ncbi:mitochondrial 30S ribosomal protein S19 [Irpex lacteus]|nr:mitochondrial 30S ribosomal protein S19 [Irpex lacteus]